MLKDVIWVKCCGEAHENPEGYDHCSVCIPFWWQYPTCPECGKKINKQTEKKKLFRCKEHGYFNEGNHL